jgi:hypothetical protein
MATKGMRGLNEAMKGLSLASHTCREATSVCEDCQHGNGRLHLIQMLTHILLDTDTLENADALNGHRNRPSLYKCNRKSSIAITLPLETRFVSLAVSPTGSFALYDD